MRNLRYLAAKPQNQKSTPDPLPQSRQGGLQSRGNEHDILFLTTELPPSTNALYQHRGHGKLALTETAQRFRESVKALVVANLAKVTAFPTEPELIYCFDITCFFDSLENPGWFEYWEQDAHYQKDSKDGCHKKGELKHRQGERKAATRYKRIDYDNRIKFLQDCVSKSIGIPDDSQIFVGRQEKREDPDHPRAEVLVTIERNTSRFFSRKGNNGPSS